MKFSVDDRVYYASGRFGSSGTNPCKGSDYACAGTVTSIDLSNISVEWDNGYNNIYNSVDLEMTHRFETGDPNLSWKRMKQHEI